MAKKELDYEFDPVKEAKNGEQAKQVIWSTKVINTAVEAIKKGLPLKVNPFIGNNTKLLKPELVFKRTEEEIEEYVRCMQDICYFAEKCYVMTPEGLQQIKLRDYQHKYLQHLQNNRFSIYLACRQAGKCFSYMSSIIIKINDLTYFNKIINNWLKKYNYYIDNNYYIELPIFELFKLYNNSFIWKCRYYLYKLIYDLELWQGKTDKTKSDIMKKVQNILNITKS